MPKNFYSPTMLKKYLACKHIIFNELNEEKLKLKRVKITKRDSIRFEKGNIHEEEYFKSLKKKYSKVKNIKNLKNVNKFKETLDAMKNGFEVIYGGWLGSDKWIGEFDFLEINKNLKSNLGNYSYEIIDTKNRSKVKGEDIYQCSTYNDLLENAQGVLPENFYILLKNNKKEKVILNKINEVFKSHKTNYEKFLKNGVKGTKAEKCSACSFCDWREHCEDEWKTKRNLNQVYGTNKKNIKKFLNRKINTSDKLAKLNPESKIEGLRDEVKKKLIKQAKLQLEYEKTGKPIFEHIKENLNLKRGFNLLPQPSKCDLFFDLESVPDYVVEGKLEYLWGLYYVENDKKIFKPMWAHNKQEEIKNIIKFFDFTKSHFEKYPDAKIYHYASYEIKALERLTSINKLKHIEYDHYLNLDKFVDLFRVVKQAVQVSENSYSIKNIEKFYPDKFKRSGDIQKGQVSEEYYIEWLETKNQKLLEEIEDYNKQDCVSTYYLREWLLDIKPKNTSWFVPDKEEIEIRDHEKLIIEYQNKLNNSKIKNKDLLKLMSDIVGFFLREQKPEWRLFFDRKGLTDEELIEDRECIGNCKLVSTYPDKKSIIYTYTFPEQEYKLKKGRRVIIANNADPLRGDYAGTIEELDQINRRIKLRKGKSKEENQLPRILSVSEKVMEHSRFNNLNKNIYRYCQNILENKNDYKALTSFLNKDIPSIQGIKPGEKIIKTENFDKEIPDVISRLNNSFLFIQGPCGTGKTYQAANAIVELIKKKKKIAITANSHKVIHNLLERIEDIADKKVEFKGLKMGNPENEDTFYDGQYIKTSKNEKYFIDGLNDNSVLLFAGTKFHLSSWYYQKKIDYLFIDEASQISLSDLIALGSITKNIILVGDQQQLGSISQGSHPGESSKSVLDYLLEGKATIPEDRGIFLNKTFRLNSKINSFISPCFYENRLLVHEKNKQRKINFSKSSLIKSEGIHYIQMDHEDNSQTSHEEYETISKIMKQLIGSKFNDIDNKVRNLTIEDILIVSPYNAQVNYLLARLDKGARVGTVDRFQGQEAPICIISMTSSDSDNLPRDKKFAFDFHRLNVAISRAQCASIILFNPRLLETPPTDYEEMLLLNNFYKLLNYKVN